MAVPAAPTPLIGVPLNPVAPPEVDAAGTDGVIEVLGRLVRDLQAAPPDAVDGDTPSEETVHSLRLLTLDNLIEIVQLREAIAERETTITSLRIDVDVWQERCKTLSEARASEKVAAHQRERELITVLHRTLLENDSMQAELQWRRRPWFRRGRRPQVTATPAQLLGSAAR
jgi:hypothetical protein